MLQAEDYVKEKFRPTQFVNQMMGVDEEIKEDAKAEDGDEIFA